MSPPPSSPHSPSRPLLLILTVAVVLGGLWVQRNRTGNLTAESSPPEAPGNSPASQLAFEQTYLDPAAGRSSPVRTACSTCHETPGLFPPDRWKSLSQRSELDQRAWAEAAGVSLHCGACHLVSGPAMLPHQSWIETFARMTEIRSEKGLPPLSPDQRSDLLHYHLTFSPARQPRLAPDPKWTPGTGPFRITREGFGTPRAADSRVHPLIGNVRIADLDHDGRPDGVVCDTDAGRVNWVHRRAGSRDWIEETLAVVPHPSRCQVWTRPETGRTDLIVACQRRIDPTEDPVGSVIWLKNDGDGHFTAQTVVEGLGRLADVEPGDFNGDGKMDFVVAGFGFIRTGEVGWLENLGDERWRYHTIVVRTGAIDVLPIDLNGDGRLDFVALFAQEHEMISVFINDGRGGFREQVLFRAATPAYGSSGIQLADLDGDGDVDILYTNGDNMDLPTRIPRPFHGVQWLENKGGLRFEWHDIRRWYGAYTSVVADLDHDGHLDIVVGSLFNDWDDPNRASLMWLRNDGTQQFTAHTLAREPSQLISLAVADLDGDGVLSVIGSGMHGFPPYDRMARLTRWRLEPTAVRHP